MNYCEKHRDEAIQILKQFDLGTVEKMVALLADLRTRQGRLFLLGVGGSAANCSHAVNDFRKLCGIEAYAPTDNVSELTARTNDEGWASVFVEWLRTSKLSAKDMIFVLSVGGGSLEKNISPNLVAALRHAQEVGAQVVGIVGRDGRVHGQGSRRLLDRPYRKPGHGHATYGSFPGRDLAFARVPSCTEGSTHEMGIDQVTRCAA